MENIRKQPDSTPRPLLEIQVTYCPHPAPGRVQVEYTYANHVPGVLKSWRTEGGAISVAQVRDLNGVIENAVIDSLMKLLVVRGGLPGA